MPTFTLGRPEGTTVADFVHKVFLSDNEMLTGPPPIDNQPIFEPQVATMFFERAARCLCRNLVPTRISIRKAVDPPGSDSHCKYSSDAEDEALVFHVRHPFD